MRHNVISGKSDGGHLGFMQIRPLVLKDFCPPPKNITKYILRSPCAKFHEFIPKCTPGPKIWTVSMDYLASIMTHDHAKDLCASELGLLRI